MKKPIKVAVIIGTRPELIKVSPLLRKMQADPAFDFLFIDTGQHYDYEMDSIFCEELNLPQPVLLNIGSATPPSQIGTGLLAIEKHVTAYQPDLAMVVGDTNSTLSGALTASKMNIPIAHVEAGLRSFDRTMPEEVNRVIVDHISRWLFAPTQQSIENLKAEGISGNLITFTHDMHVDVLQDNFELAVERSKIRRELALDNYVLVTCHRQSNTDIRENLANIVSGLKEIADTQTVVFPAHPRTVKKLHDHGLYELLDQHQNIHVIKPLGFFDFLSLMGHARCVITDSGGVQKETLILKTPCVTIRENTEWVETTACNANVLVGTDPGKLVDQVNQRSQADFQEFMQTVVNPYGDGTTSQIILDKICQDMSA